MKDNPKNRAKQISVDKQFQKGVKLLDIDTTNAEYMNDTVITEVEEHGQAIKVALL